MMKKRKVGRLKNADTKYLGQEPTEIKSLLDYAYALNWYNYFYEVKNAKKWLIEYCRNNNLSLTDVKEINMTMCSIARMLNKGMAVPDNSKYYLLNKIATKKPPIHKAEVIKIASRKFPLDKFEEKLGEFYNGEYKYFEPKTYDMLKELGARPIDAKSVADYYTPLLNELQEYAVDYKYLGKKKLANYVKFVSAIIDDAVKYGSNKRATVVRKPRKKKAVDASKLASKVKYLKEDSDLKIASVQPQNIVGASLVWLYNTKYKKISKLIVNKDEKFTLKGTTIQNVDLNASSGKTVRKPAEFLTVFNSATKLSKNKLYRELKTKESAINGRINEHVLILGVY